MSIIAKKQEQLKKAEELLDRYDSAQSLTQRQAEMRQALVDEIRDLRAELAGPGPQALTVGNGRITSAMSTNGFNSLGEWLLTVKKAETPGGQTDPRLFQAAATGLNETVGSEGGFLPQYDLVKGIYQAAFDNGKLAKLCRQIPVGPASNGIKIPGLDETSRVAGSRHGGVLSYFIAEAGEKQASKPAFRVVELNLHKMVVLIYSTDELLMDAPALEAFIRKVASDEISFSLDDAIVNGTGVGQPLGILNSGALVTVDKEAGQKAATVVWENIVHMWSRLIGSSRPNAVWLVNQDIEPQLYSMSLAVGTGGVPVYMPAGGASNAPYASLFGRPVIPCEQCATLGTVGDIVLGDFQNGYALATKGGLQADVSIHVRFIYDESVFRFVFRVDGQPMLASPVTPFKGSATQSHFVALQAR